MAVNSGSVRLHSLRVHEVWTEEVTSVRSRSKYSTARQGPMSARRTTPPSMSQGCTYLLDRTFGMHNATTNGRSAPCKYRCSLQTLLQIAQNATLQHGLLPTLAVARARRAANHRCSLWPWWRLQRMLEASTILTVPAVGKEPHNPGTCRSTRRLPLSKP